MSLLQVSGIAKQLGGSYVVQGVTFQQEQFQKLAIAGETGSGKSSVLKMIAGLAQVEEGQVIFDGRRVEGPMEKLVPGVPGIAYLSQHFELRNNYRVEELLSYANVLPGEEAEILFEVCRIDHLLKRRTDQLSGGEKQRIALARLLISSPKLLLLDEPFSNLDMIHKSVLKAVIADIGEKLRITCTLVSHDPDDTLSWADAVLVLKEGRIVQQGAPQQVYKNPVNEYVAGLFGRYNLISNGLEKILSVMYEGKYFPRSYYRPEHFKISVSRSKLKGIVKDVFYFGSWHEVAVMLPEDIIMVRCDGEKIRKGDTVYLSLSADGLRTS
jgi:iron(III) transport system ATP-binding protein